ncbi:hypothetical protein P4C99_02320 [Pontiellaceae bacterium B1224]|nr:hypothetical protein [Pontiellaceae bacterium B1224]
MQATTIKPFLPTGDATGIRKAEIPNWTCVRKSIRWCSARNSTAPVLGHDDVGESSF